MMVRSLFPGSTFLPLDDGDLSYLNPPNGQVYAGLFGDLGIVAAPELGLEKPSSLQRALVSRFASGNLYLHAMHSAVDFFAFAVWERGTLRRALSLSTETGIAEDVGPRFEFELPFWAGNHPVTDPSEEDEAYPFPFHPLELAESALLEFFGFQLEGVNDPTHVDPESITLMRFERKTSLFQAMKQRISGR